MDEDCVFVFLGDQLKDIYMDQEGYCACIITHFVFNK